MERSHKSQLVAFVYQWRPHAVSVSPCVLGHSGLQLGIPEDGPFMRGLAYLQIAW